MSHNQLLSMSNIGVVVLAAGKGSRLGCTDIPKVMLEIGGRPIVSYTVETLEKMGFTNDQIVLVVGFCKEKVMDYFGDRVTYAVQEELKGTAHAAFTGMQQLPSNAEHVLVMGGDDSAFYSAESVLSLLQQHVTKQTKVSLLTAHMNDPAQLGRIVRHENGDIEVIEKEYLTEEQKLIHEISTGTFVFDRAWFEHMFPSMPPLRKLGEYGLPTSLAMARQQQLSYQAIPLTDSSEFFGVNTKEELAEAQRRKSIVSTIV